MLFTRHSDGKLIFAILRGDMQLSLAKLENRVGKISPASEKEIFTSGAVPGYASPVGLEDALIIVDDLIPLSSNLVAGANEAGFHLKHVNYGRDYQAELVCDLALAKVGDACAACGSALEEIRVERLAARDKIGFLEILHAVAETHHDERGLILPITVAPFVVYLMHVPGKTMDTRAAGEEIYAGMMGSGITVLYDDREERAGVKFNDADLIGCPLRITVGEKSLADGMVELKLRAARESTLQRADHILEAIQAVMK
jgi:prolyl-tRNA synthetase